MLTTAGPTLAAAFAKVSLPKHPQECLGLPSDIPEAFVDGIESAAKENNRNVPTLKSSN